MKALVGCTGFVGSNLYSQTDFDGAYNSKNISDAFGTSPDLLVYAGVRAEMFLANNFPEKDFAQIQNAAENIKKINPKFLVLISTVSVYGENARGDENTEIDESRLSAYGKNRLYLEKWAESNWKNRLIVRLPAIYGKNLKKNFIYDYIHVIPALLKYEKFNELCKLNLDLKNFYERQENGFYKCKNLSEDERRNLVAFFNCAGFSALNFTDSRSRYQFYNLKNLWSHIEKSISSGIKKINLATEPLQVSELYEFLSGKEFKNELAKPPFNYNLTSVHAQKFGGQNGYLFTKEQVMEDIKKFVKEEKK